MMMARPILEEAHKRMTPAEIANHALDLVDLVEADRALLDLWARDLRKAERLRISLAEALATTLATIGDVQRLYRKGQKLAARRLIEGLAAGPIEIERPALDYLDLKPLRPEVFDPTLEKIDG